MNERLMTEADLYRVTKLKQNAARVRWFLTNFGVGARAERRRQPDPDVGSLRDHAGPARRRRDASK